MARLCRSSQFSCDNTEFAAKKPSWYGLLYKEPLNNWEYWIQKLNKNTLCDSENLENSTYSHREVSPERLQGIL